MTVCGTPEYTWTQHLLFGHRGAVSYGTYTSGGLDARMITDAFTEALLGGALKGRCGKSDESEGGRGVVERGAMGEYDSPRKQQCPTRCDSVEAAASSTRRPQMLRRPRALAHLPPAPRPRLTDALLLPPAQVGMHTVHFDNTKSCK